jgi:hypothetical protein
MPTKLFEKEEESNFRDAGIFSLFSNQKTPLSPMKTNTNRELLLMHKFTEEWSTNFSSQVSRIMNIVDQQDTLDGIIPIIEVANVYNQRFAHARTDKENLLKNRKARPFEFLIHKN